MKILAIAIEVTKRKKEMMFGIATKLNHQTKNHLPVDRAVHSFRVTTTTKKEIVILKEVKKKSWYV